MGKQSAAVFVIAMLPVMAAAQKFIPTSGAPVAPDTRFEVVSIKPINDANAPMRTMTTPTGFESSLPVGGILRQALQKPDYQMVGAPGWINTERYSIRAKPPAGTPPAAMSVMMLNLLRDRFQLATHLETREQPIFHLVMARSDGRLGPNLTLTLAACRATVANREEAMKRGAPPLFDPTDSCGSGRSSPGLFAFTGSRLARLVAALSDLMGRPVIDKTGLTGLYDLTLKFAYEGRMPGIMGPLGAPPAPTVDPDAPSLSAALQEQLGLRLESVRGPVEVVVIDKLEKPTPD
jgi:bla regulator protein blaR1